METTTTYYRTTFHLNNGTRIIKDFTDRNTAKMYRSRVLADKNAYYHHIEEPHLDLILKVEDITAAEIRSWNQAPEGEKQKKPFLESAFWQRVDKRGNPQ